MSRVAMDGKEIKEVDSCKSMQEFYAEIGCDVRHGSLDDSPRLLTKEQGELVHQSLVNSRGTVYLLW